ncbi:hypothetical protein THER_2059 [Thermodesulfovibrio sp. N1]|nr:hypothetical protein THER_2059 [Thermodesulfovibrio sp. N1]
MLFFKSFSNGVPFSIDNSYNEICFIEKEVAIFIELIKLVIV